MIILIFEFVFYSHHHHRLNMYFIRMVKKLFFSSFSLDFFFLEYKKRTHEA